MLSSTAEFFLILVIQWSWSLSPMLWMPSLFWAQVDRTAKHTEGSLRISRTNGTENFTPQLAGLCLFAVVQFYGACYSEDRCWYRCKVQQQGKSFLQNLIYRKKLRINKKSVCFDGTILVQAFQGSHDNGEEVLKFKFAKVNLPGNIESPFPGKALTKQTGQWSSRGPQADGDNPGSLGCMPNLRPAFTNQKPQGLMEQSTSATSVASNGERGESRSSEKKIDSTAVDRLWESTTVLGACQTKGELEDLVKSRNQSPGFLISAINDFLLEVDSLPISQCLESPKEAHH
ncbi:hypothetical protein SRHO_G00051590 [Serrasalmus rhombeus]